MTVGMSNTLLEGHLCITRELVMFLPPERKEEVGIGAKCNLIRELVEDWIFPASKLWLIFKQKGDIPENRVAVCQTPCTTAAAFELLVALCTGCHANLEHLSGMLFEMFYNEGSALSEWDYLPPVGPRPKDGFVGLKNAGATCYMNSVLQQLFMLENLQRGILAADGACKDPNEDFSVDERMDDDMPEETGDRNEYNVTILKQIQAIFGHLAETQLQYYVPKGLWKHFRMSGEPVNLREQQDAVEFLMTLIDNLDEALKHLGHPQICSQVLGGILSDQKICKTCPHRYSTQAPSSVIPVDVQHHSNLVDSLAEYTKGELLETENAYYCEQCDKKVDTVKRLCIKKLPPILVIQLNRFQYDHERDTTVKFNDYFEFPRELDMEPYTVAGLAKRENEAVDFEPEDLDPNIVRKYNLRGMVVHSGQASGGHYYSYIRQGEKWYKFDDGDVTEVSMEDDEELKNQCWGGEYLSEVFDHVVKKMSFRRQKRWWNAYMLFYARQDLDIQATANIMERKRLKMPLPIEKSIVKQNVRFLHNRNGFSAEYFNFIKRLISCNTGYVTVQPDESPTKEQEEMSLATVKLASAFLFTIGFHTKKSVRGNAMEWYDILSVHLRTKVARIWFCNNVLFAHPSRFPQYLLECPAPEVRQAFAKLIVFCAHFSLPDGPTPPPRWLQNIPETPVATNLSDHLLLAVLSLLWSEVADYGRNLAQYFGLFVMYITLGVKEKAQLLNLSVPAIFIQVSLDDGPGPSIKYQYAELGKLYQVVSNLVRCCDVSCVTQSSQEGGEPLPNPYLESSLQQHNQELALQGSYIMPIPLIVAEQLFQRSAYLKKVIEDANSTEDTKKLLQFCSWENPTFSHTVLYELLWQIAFAYTHELRPYLQLLLAMLTLEDSWQHHRILKALKGIPDDHSSRDGLFETIQRSKNHYQKRAYQCIKMLVTLFSTCQVAKNILMSHGELKKKWSWSVEWLHEELERGGGGGGGGAGGRGGGPGQGGYQGGGAGNPAPHLQYYSNWSPPAGSNETAHGYFLERSHSARSTLEKAFELLPEDSEEGEDAGAGGQRPGDAGGAAAPRGDEESEAGAGGGGVKKGGAGGHQAHFDDNY